MRRLAATGAVLALLAACGFHLQGVGRLPPALASATIESPDHYSDFHRAFVASLERAGVKLDRAGAAPGVVIEVLRDESGQRVLSVSARNTPTEYEVYYNVRYRVRSGARELLAPQSLSLTRDYSFDENAFLAKEEEQAVIREALAQELAALAMRRLAAL